MEAALEAAGASLVASHSLAGGVAERQVLGERRRPAAWPRRSSRRGRYREALRIGAALGPVALRLDTTPATLAIAFSLAHPRTATTLVGATSPAQIDELLGGGRARRPARRRRPRGAALAVAR